MPNIKSNSKHLRKSRKRQVYNRAIKAQLKTINNKILGLLNNKQVDEATVVLRNFYTIADKATIKGVLKKKTSARKKSKLAKKIDFLKQDGKKTEKEEI